MKVYIVTTGEYSDYGIDKVFLDKEKAELYAHNIALFTPWNHYRVEVEEYEITTDVVFGDDEAGNYIHFTAEFDGKTRELVSLNPYAEIYPAGFCVLESKGEYTVEGSVSPRLNETVGEIRERIKKVAIDKFYRYLYENEKGREAQRN